MFIFLIKKIVILFFTHHIFFYMIYDRFLLFFICVYSFWSLLDFVFCNKNDVTVHCLNNMKLICWVLKHLLWTADMWHLVFCSDLFCIHFAFSLFTFILYSLCSHSLCVFFVYIHFVCFLFTFILYVFFLLVFSLLFHFDFLHEQVKMSAQLQAFSSDSLVTDK